MFPVGRIAVSELLSVVFLISLGFGMGSFSTLNAFDVSQENPSYNLSCPEPVVQVEKSVKQEMDQLRTEKTSDYYIQNPESQISFNRTGKSINVKIDAISRPEGMSMRPTIFTGNTVLLDKYEGGKLQEGQIIRYRSDDGGHIIHRIRSNYLDTEGYLQVKGDNTESSEKVEKGQVTHLVEGVLFT